MHTAQPPSSSTNSCVVLVTDLSNRYFRSVSAAATGTILTITVLLPRGFYWLKMLLFLTNGRHWSYIPPSNKDSQLCAAISQLTASAETIQKPFV